MFYTVDNSQAAKQDPSIVDTKGLWAVEMASFAIQGKPENGKIDVVYACH